MKFRLNPAWSVSGFVVAGLLGACSFAPHYEPPANPTSDQYKELPADWKAAEPADARTRGAWWLPFGDDQLNALEDQVASGNQTLRSALDRYLQAHAQAQYARADLFPSLNANASATRERQSKNRATYISSGLVPDLYSDYVLNADLSYEIDLWGRVRNTVEAGKDTAQASAGDLASVALSSQAELASDYFLVRGYDTQQALLDDTVKAYQRALELTQNRFKGGVAAAFDVDQAQTQLQNALTQSADNQLKRAQTEHAIAVLIGQAPANFSLPVSGLTATPLPIDPGLPSQLLERRPDIAAGERRVAAANAQIGVARAAFFPVFSISAIAGLESASPASWFEAPSRLWSFGPSSALTLLDFGRRDAVSRQARAAYDQAVADYRQSVLTAYQDVEDNLVALQQLESENRTQTLSAAAAQRAQMQAENRYKGGISTYLEVVTAQSTSLQAQLALAQVQLRQVTASVQLIKALGGGWNVTQLDLPVATQKLDSHISDAPIASSTSAAALPSSTEQSEATSTSTAVAPAATQ